MKLISLTICLNFLFPGILLSYQDKYLFMDESSCKKCVAEISSNLTGKEKEYMCRLKDSSKPGKGYFIEMRNTSSSGDEFLRLIEKENRVESSRKKRIKITQVQKGLVEKDIRKLCPGTYRGKDR